MTTRTASRTERSQLPAPGMYRLDPPHTFVFFAAQHKIVGKVRGRFDKTAGTVTVDEDLAACAVDVTIESASIDTQNSVRDNDLRGPDFFQAAKSPTITYRGRGIRPTEGWVIDGSLVPSSAWSASLRTKSDRTRGSTLGSRSTPKQLPRRSESRRVRREADISEPDVTSVNHLRRF